MAIILRIKSFEKRWIMYNVIIYGNGNSNSINETLIRALSNYGGVHSHIENSISSHPESEKQKFLLYDLNKFPSISKCSGFLIFKKSFLPFDKNLIPNNFIPILDSHNLNAAQILKGTDKLAITCGTSSKDTLSIASLDDNTAVISLQRYVKAFNSKIIEPHDFTVKLSKETQPYPLLVTCAVLILSEFNTKSGFEF